jgi:acyl-CoA thioesterase FadM
MPARVGDRLSAKISGVHIGRSSYTLAWTFSIDGNLAMQAQVKRVAMNVATGVSVDLPEAFRKWIVETQNRTAKIS